jgi:DUF1365 family protein
VNSALYSGWIAHRRLAPRRHDFRYRIGLLYLDLDEQDAVLGLSPLSGFSRFSPFSFRESDYLKTFTGNGMRLIDAVREQVRLATGHAPQGSICLLTQPRSWGLAFNPVSFFYCYEADGQLAAILAEVTNTPWRERYHYVLPARTPEDLHDFHQHFAVAKAFHVSPFLPRDLEHRMSFRPRGEKARRAHGRLAGRAEAVRRHAQPETRNPGPRQPAPLFAALPLDDRENRPGDLLASPASVAQTRTDICSSGCRRQLSNRHRSAQGSPP